MLASYIHSCAAPFSWLGELGEETSWGNGRGGREMSVTEREGSREGEKREEVFIKTAPSPSPRLSLLRVAPNGLNPWQNDRPTRNSFLFCFEHRRRLRPPRR